MTTDCQFVTRALSELFREGVAGAMERERTAFDRLTSPCENSLVLFGAGGIGRKTAAGLHSLGIAPLSFADNNPSLWGKEVAGIPISSPQEALKRFGSNAAFVVTIWRGEGPERTRDRVRFLQDLGCTRVCTFGPLYWKYSDTFLPHYAAAPAHEVHQRAEEILEAALLWDDDATRREFLSQIRWRLSFDFDVLSDPVQHPAYFPPDLFCMTGEDVFVDCGAYDGDTLFSLLEQPQPAFRRIFAFEPDPRTFARLSERVSALPCRSSILLHQAATGMKTGRLRFSADGTPSSALGDGDTEVDCVALDEALKGIEPTFIKMDIEGAELAALEGSRQIIQQYAPILAISSYHRQDHLWNVARLIHSMRSDYHFFLRPHMQEAWDVICYAVPDHRLKKSA
jgi:FkbM family methyltransferase